MMRPVENAGGTVLRITYLQRSDTMHQSVNLRRTEDFENGGFEGVKGSNGSKDWAKRSEPCVTCGGST